MDIKCSLSIKNSPQYFSLRYSDNPELLKEVTETGNGCTAVYLESTYLGEYRVNSKIPLKIYVSKDIEEKSSKGTILCIHGIGNRCLTHFEWFPKYFAKLGYNGALMTLPYHGERLPDGKTPYEFYLKADRYTVLERFENAVTDARICIKYLKNKYSGPIYLLGFSMGGLMSVICAALSPEIKALSAIVSGANFYYITWESIATKILRVQYEKDGGCNKNICRECHGEKYYDYINTLTSPNIELNSAPISCYEFDPLTYAKFVEQPVLMQNAVFDMFFPFYSVKELYKALPNARLKWLPSGHMSSFLYRKKLARKTDSFFKGL